MSTDLDRTLHRILDDLEFIKRRLTVPIGDGTVMTYLADETPMYVNQDDFGCASNLINGGLYEEDNFWVFLSFLKPDTVFLDIGANVGVFSMRLAPRIKSGRIYSFEPNPKLCRLLKQSAFLNGHPEKIHAHEMAISDANGEARFFIPEVSAGGASLIKNVEGSQVLVCQTRRLDDLMPPDFTCDLVKLDVEDHELGALNGMRGILGRSAGKIKILFEKIGASQGNEEGLHAYWSEFGMRLYHVEYPSRLVPVGLDEFKAKSGYFLAIRPELLEDRLRRGFLNIYPQQLNILAPHRFRNTGGITIQGKGTPETLLFHGPYWYLPKGHYQFRIAGHCKSALEITLAERFGYPVLNFPYDGKTHHANFITTRDLIRFEIFARPTSPNIDLDFERIEFEKLD
jgi:FkbM family methyltransferase